MAVRSVAELLPRLFEDLTLADIPAMLERAGEERESLFIERKVSVSPESLAKSCAAFANTYGGLLVVGVADESNELVGIDRAAREAQVWVKDTLRGHLLPLPPFRARWLPLADTRGLLLVLVAESSTTPHLLTRRGAIYVRNPGSSDPVPINDQRRLLDLVARGERARDTAAREALETAGNIRVDGVASWQLLAAVPTGVAEDYRQRLFSQTGAARVLQVLNDAYGETSIQSLPPAEIHGPLYDQHLVRFERMKREWAYRRFELAAATGFGAVAAGHGYPAGYEEGVAAEQLVQTVGRLLNATRDALLDLGAHGDLRLAWSFRLPEPRHIWFPRERVASGTIDVVVERWGSLEADEQVDHALVVDLVAEVGRAGGVGPMDTDPPS